MKLARYMAREGLDDETMAARVRTDEVKCDRTMISRYRLGRRRPDWPMINRIAVVTREAVTADDWMHLEAAE
jgi:transcriptional regulator with XRE-family HTH domain